MSTSKAISLEDIKKKAKGILVDIPDWEPGKMIKVRLRTIDITPLLMESGTIPDQLSAEVAEMFDKEGKSSKTAPLNMEKMLPVLEAIAKESLVEPTYDEINEIYPLTMTQKLAIFNFIVGGIEKMTPFRQE